MKSLSIIVLALFINLNLIAQGIQFETGPWKEVVAKAKAQNKLIYMDVYAEWCGPCKMMARDVFPNEKAGAKYNELFINFKIDAEKGEGRDIARQYGVGSYPTNLYINPNDESVVYRVAGACGVDEFIRRADIAQQDFKDPLTWNQYEETLKKNPKDYSFIQKYIHKAGRLGKDNDAAINAYVKHHMSIPPHDSNIYFLVMNVHTFDNDGYEILKNNQERMDKMIQDPRQRFAEREKAYWFQGTYKKAVANNDIKVLESIKPVLYKYNPLDSIGKWYWAEQMFYSTLKNDKELLKSYKNAIKYYNKFSPKEINELDAKMQALGIANLRNQPQYAKLPEDQFKTTVDNQLKSLAFAKPFTSNIVSAHVNASKYVIDALKTDKKALKEAKNWLDNASKVATDKHPAYENILQTQAIVQYYLGEQKAAENTIESLLDWMKINQKNPKQIEAFKAQIVNKTFK